MEPKSEINMQIQNDPFLNVVAQAIVYGFDNLYTSLDLMKQKANDQRQIVQLSQIQEKIDSLATKTLAQSRDLRVTNMRTNVEQELQKLRQQLFSLQKQHQQLAQKHCELQSRVTNLQCTMVTKEQFNQLKNKCEQRFSLFDNRFKVIQNQHKKLLVYVDQKFKKSIKPSEQFQSVLNQLMKTNYRMFQYARKMYWSLINQILAFRALSTGMVQKSQSKSILKQNSIFNELINIVSSATYLIAGIPFAGGIFLVIKDLSSVLFAQRQDAMTKNIRLRVQEYFTQEEIAQDVASAVLQLIKNPCIQNRLEEMRIKAKLTSALEKFFQFISLTQFTPQALANNFLNKLARIKYQKQTEENQYLTENVATDTSLILWKIAQAPSANKRLPITQAVKNLFSSKCSKFPLTNQIQTCKLPCQIENAVLERNFIIDDQAEEVSKDNQGTDQLLCKNYQPQKVGLSEGVNLQNFGQKNENNFNNPNNHKEISKQADKNISSKVAWQTNNQNCQRPTYFKLRVVKAEINIKKSFFRMSLYCIIKYKNKIFFTECERNGDNKPVWNQEYIFQASNTPSTITLQVYDKQKVFKDSLIGNATMIDTQFDKRQQQVQLWNADKVVGKLYFYLQP